MPGIKKTKNELSSSLLRWHQQKKNSNIISECSGCQAFILFQPDSGASLWSDCESPPASAAPVASETNCPSVLAVQSAPLGSVETNDASIQENHATVWLNISFLGNFCFVWLWDRFRSLEGKTKVIMGSDVCVYLKEALGILQEIQTTVAAVVLLRNSTVGAPHRVLCKQTRCPPADLPLHLQVAEERTSIKHQLRIKHPSNSTVEDDSYWKKCKLNVFLNEFWTVAMFF